jgi:hypothetical protein
VPTTVSEKRFGGHTAEVIQLTASRAEVRLLLSTMRTLDASSPIVKALHFLQEERRLLVSVVVAQESQRISTRDIFPSAEFHVRGLGEWPQSQDATYGDEVMALYSTVASSYDFPNVKKQVAASLNRHDSSGTFRLVDREVYFQQSLLEILSILSRTRVTHVFFDITPHVSRDYLLYWVARTLGLEVLFLQPVPWAGLAIPKNDVDGCISPDSAIWDFEGCTEASDFYRFVIGQGETLVRNLKESNAHWVAKYQGPEIRKLDAQHPSFLKSVASIRQKMSGRNSINLSGLEQSGVVEQLLSVFLEWRLRRDFLKARVSVNSVKFTPPSNYVFFALTHEPERTFFPEALPHESQFDVALQIAANLVPGYRLLVKEHETQFVPGRRGYASRSLEFYRTLKQVENIEVVPSTASAKSLVQGSSVVVSATGTICLEAALQGKPSYYFGNPWWAGFPGTTKLHDFTGISTNNSVVVNDDDIDLWLRNFVAKCLPTTSNVDFGDFSQKFAPLPANFPSLEERSIRITLQRFVDGL